MVPSPQDSSVQVGDRGRQNHSDQGLCVLGWKYNVLWEEMEKKGEILTKMELKGAFQAERPA